MGSKLPLVLFGVLLFVAGLLPTIAPSLFSSDSTTTLPSTAPLQEEHQLPTRSDTSAASTTTKASLPQTKGDGDDDVVFSSTPPDVDITKRHVITSPHALRYVQQQKQHGNGRCAIPLLLTHIRYHGSSLLRTTLEGWVKHFLIPQGNIDLIITYDADVVAPKDLIAMLKLTKASAELVSEFITKNLSADGDDSDTATKKQEMSSLLRNNIQLSEENAEALGSGWFLTSYSKTQLVRIHPVRLPYPKYISDEPELLNNTQWGRCGCPPWCPTKRATKEYIQGTRWYTYDMFKEPIITQYSYWIKMDVDIWMFRAPKFNFVEEMRASNAIFAHTGYANNGAGCSNMLHIALTTYCQQHACPMVSKNSSWWVQDDHVYYSNFVMNAMSFGLSAEHMALAQFLNEYRDGFFRYRWTDQSLFHKVFGIFLGPKESDFGLDWSWMRWKKGIFHPKALFYHSKQFKKSGLLRKWTKF